ncbi:PLP-dependent aminotransferase family protein (plasmid) [Agrobacterium sp. 33MFTa1.1]|uniref:aminotransferase-like domain-containing protein n=1 Tax=Agrobacterium sp. 33MFTa1.1 TaxID=1279031 RepID=UPI000557D3F6|nr:PLP-dependent aminotransferase family protein [Agrobacterium sp. 33MFTa1.1]QBJ16533.1 PLP-dependent aminotransferase family protein [Agrobacterium sp. 33MFTa1.1]
MLNWLPELRPDSKPRYLQIADAIELAIKRGDIAAGDRLPPQRRLAERLGIDFTTVSRAYAEAHSRRLVESHVGRGTFALGRPKEEHQIDPRRAGDEDLSMNMPPEPQDPDLVARMQDGLQTVSANLISLLRYQSTTGGEQDKAAASSWLSKRGMVPSLERIAITPGAHATMTAILSTMTRPGDVVLCEAVTYPGLRAIAARMGLQLVGIPMDASGILPDALDAAIHLHQPKALYLNPTVHNPTTLTIPRGRRMEIAEVILRHRLPLIEDDAYGFIPAAAPVPFATLAPDLTWHIGGLAKCLGAGLRLAYTVSPNTRAAYSLSQAMRASAVMPSPICMALATRWIEDGTADAVRHFVRTESSARHKIAIEALPDLDVRGEPEAFSIWLKLPKGFSRAELMGRMAGRHVGLMPSDAFTVLGAPDEHVRVCLGGIVNREQLRAGLLFMANSLSDGGWMG